MPPAAPLLSPPLQLRAGSRLLPPPPLQLRAGSRLQPGCDPACHSSACRCWRLALS